MATFIPMNNRYSFSMNPEQLRKRVATDEALLDAISKLESDAKITASNASRAVHEAQTALLAAHAWLASAMATYESYRLEHLRLTEMVARSRSLLHLAAASLPDELIVQIAQMCVEDAREPLYNGRLVFEGGPGEVKWNVGWVYPLALSQICRRWRMAVLGCPRLWAYRDNLARLSPSLLSLISLRSGSCTLDVVWNGSTTGEDNSPSTSQIHSWRSLKVFIPTPSTEPLPLSSTTRCTSLSSLSLRASHKMRAPAFASHFLSQMPALTKLELLDVHFLAPPPYRHDRPIDLSIRYNGVISFREKDMNDISIVFPKLRKFSLHIRGPYINKPSANHGFSSEGSIATSGSNSEPTQQPFQFPELTALDISAKDLSHSLVRLNNAYLPKLSYLRLRDNGLGAAIPFFQHLVRSGVPLDTLSLTDFSPRASAVFRNHEGITGLEFELTKVAVEALRPQTQGGDTELPAIAGFSPTPTTPPTPPITFPYVSTITLLPPSPATAGGSVGKSEAVPLQLLARAIRERTELIIKTSGGTVLREKELPRPPVEENDVGAKMDQEGEKDQAGPMRSNDSFVNNEPAGTMTSVTGKQDGRVFGHSRVWSGERARRMTVTGKSVLGMVPILDVKYTPLRSRGRTAMEEVFNALVDSRRSWGRLLEARFGSE